MARESVGIAGGWGGWRSLGGNLLAGTGPAAAYVTGDGPYTLVTGTNHELYVEGPGVTGFTPAGARPEPLAEVAGWEPGGGTPSPGSHASARALTVAR